MLISLFTQFYKPCKNYFQILVHTYQSDGFPKSNSFCGILQCLCSFHKSENWKNLAMARTRERSMFLLWGIEI